MVYFDQTLHTYTYGKEGKDQESIQLYNTPDPGHHIEKFPILCHGSGVLFENMAKHHIQESQEVRLFSTGDHKGATCQH